MNDPINLCIYIQGMHREMAWLHANKVESIALCH